MKLRSESPENAAFGPKWRPRNLIFKGNYRNEKAGCSGLVVAGFMKYPGESFPTPTCHSREQFRDASLTTLHP